MDFVVDCPWWECLRQILWIFFASINADVVYQHAEQPTTGLNILDLFFCAEEGFVSEVWHFGAPGAGDRVMSTFNIMYLLEEVMSWHLTSGEATSQNLQMIYGK